MARISKKTTGQKAIESVDISELLKRLEIPFKIKNHEFAKFLISEDFAIYDDQFKADFINLVGSGVPFANVYMRINLTKERREMGQDKPQFKHNLLTGCTAEEITYFFQNTASREPAQPLSYAMKNFVFVPIQNWKEQAAFVYEKWAELHGIQPSKNPNLEAEKTTRKPKTKPEDEKV